MRQFASYKALFKINLANVEYSILKSLSLVLSLTVAIDGSEDHDINIRGLVNYQVQLSVTTSDMDPLDPSGSDSGSDSDESTTSS